MPATTCESTLVQNMLSDQSNYYSADSLAKLGAGFLVGGVMANTTIDEGIRRHFQASIRGASSDEWFEGLRANRELGNGLYTLPILTTAWAGGRLFDGQPGAKPIGDWGERSLRTFVVGAPPMLAMQYLTGASRPGEKTSQSHWEPFQDINGVSGHSFMGAIPFINAAMLTDDPALKTLFYAGSSLAPLSRINDDAHYASQALLGWWMAYVAASAVDATMTGESSWRILPFPDSSVTGIAIEHRR
ncbi:MAG: hypothetical protein KDA84_06690 [Planctomycetaceae bacterium]|nr:hypothetical protein [Planctomycetaceae bacterium]